MPKHVPSFKHLLATSHSRGPAKRPEKSVNDLLTSSRTGQQQQQQHAAAASSSSSLGPLGRETPPHLRHGERVWVPSPGTAGDGGGGGLGLVDVQEGAVHPAELLRRSHVSQRQASRSVAGPAPPPSWRESAPNRSGSSRQVEPIQAIQPATAADLRHSSDLFSLTHRDLTSPTRSHRSTGPPGLVEHGLMAVLRHLEDERVVYLPTDEIQVDQTQVPPSSDSGKNEEITLGALLREQVAYLEPHLKAALLDLASMIPEGSSRLTDRGLGAILNSPPESMDELDPIPDHDDKDNDATSWDEPTSSTALHHLPLTLHSSPLSFIRQLPSFPGISLTSLNLAYCTITNLDRLVSALPSSLRELGLAGVRLPHKDAQENWRRGTASLGRKFIVLTMLDLSFPPVEITPGLLAGMIHPPKSRLPSLRLLGLRGRSTGSAAQSGGDVSCADQTGSAGESAAVEVRRALAAVVRGQGRQRYVDIIWE